ncbi:hypothetical protein HYPSUDRAFT_46902 [Hypholoma sublateritium FD-334 SS-4]|uniref:Secreted protein n=1 Tax=Hypholoma sublateritium (strain FD-334 SS-4) TaxID=945553 RepID=A0A0D2KQG8_HYPSF|nr:hypothetical protein HYPSUDRAFT_46902 [Hypholoma sublateritium FD-334 SS-4]
MVVSAPLFFCSLLAVLLCRSAIAATLSSTPTSATPCLSWCCSGRASATPTSAPSTVRPLPAVLLRMCCYCVS